MLVLIAIVAGCLSVFAQAPAAKPAPTLASPLNEHLPAWLRFGGEVRSRVEGFGGGAYRFDNSDGYMLSRLRINMLVQPAPWLKLFAQGQDAHAFGKNQQPPRPPFQDSMDLRQAYLELGGTENKTVGLRVGRQEMAFGEERMIGPANWVNTPVHFDAARGSIRHGRYRLDAFAASVVVVGDGQFNKRLDGNNIHGLYGSIGELIPKSVLEPYVLWRLAPRVITELGPPGKMDFFTYGFRWAGKLAGDYEYGVEAAIQRGSLGSDRMEAWGSHWQLGRTFSQWTTKPRIYGEYNYGSGDADPRDGKRGTFDTLYATPHDRWGLADQVGWRNLHHARGALEAKVALAWTIKASYHSWWLASSRDGLYLPNGALFIRVPDGSAGRHVGQEFDAQAVWTPVRGWMVNLGYAHIVPGEFLKKATPGNSYNFPYVMAIYTF
ncbi:MAG: alginate export family protein [Bryobacteraceae bacterium]